MARHFRDTYEKASVATCSNKTVHMDTHHINWEEVKAFYHTCLSHEQTAEHFGLNVATIITHAAQENWTDVADRPSREGVPGVSTEGAPFAQTTPQTGQNVPRGVSGTSVTLHCGTQDFTSAHFTSRFPMLPCIPNLTAQSVTRCHPWTVPIVAHASLTNKTQYRDYIQSSDTKDCLFCGMLGESSSLRVNRDNPPARMLAVVADYDLVITSEMREYMLTQLPIRPNFISRSYSGGTHAVWFLGTPIPLPQNPDALNKLLAIIRKELKLSNAFGALDENAYNNLFQVYHAGWDWRLIHDAPIPESRCNVWLLEALKRIHAGSGDVPLNIVAAEVEKRFPGRWRCQFEEGARGVRFWDPQADNPTASIVTPKGMVCFTGPFSWRSWESIFGPEFIRQHMADKFGAVLANCFYVNNSFYVKHPCGGGSLDWIIFTRQNLELVLAGTYGLRTKAAKGEDRSEVREAMANIIAVNSMSAARPFIYNPNTIIFRDGKRILNTSLLRVHQPDESKGKHWGDGFPWIAAFMESLFPDLMQRDRFMCEWAYAYRHAYAGNPKNGRVTFIAGDVGVGKNFLTECLVGPSLGGNIDPSSYLLGHTRFNDAFFDVGVWVCNDTVTRGDDKERQVFTASLKRIAANSEHVWEGKFKGSCRIDWSGRVYVTLNTDPVSLQILPDLDQSNCDKISLYKVSGPPLNDAKAKEKAEAEMGALCAYLLNMEYPEHCRDGARWGVKNFLHPDLKAEAISSSSTASFGEILTQYCKEYFEARPDENYLEGPATDFLQGMLTQSGLKEMLRGCETPKGFGRRMAALANTGTFPVSYRRTNNKRLWCVRKENFEKYLLHGNSEHDVDERFPF